jgi:hypothetical protein
MMAESAGAAITLTIGLATLLTSPTARRMHAKLRSAHALQPIAPDVRLERDEDGWLAHSAQGTLRIPTTDDQTLTPATLRACEEAWTRLPLLGVDTAQAMTLIQPTLRPPIRVRRTDALAELSHEIAPDLHVGFVIPLNDTPRRVTLADAERWQVSTDELYEAALQNLWDATLGAIVLEERTGAAAVYQVRQNDGLDAARILLPGLWRQLADACGERVIIAVPTQDRIFAAPEHQPEAIARLADHALRAWQRPDATVSPTFWVWEDDALTRWATHA